MADLNIPKEPAAKVHVLTEPEALLLLNASADYASSAREKHTGGRHRTEVVAEAMEREGLFDLAGDTLWLHDTMQRFERGDLKALQPFTEMPVIDNYLQHAAGTKFSTAAERIVANLTQLTEILGERNAGGIDIDWDKSSEVVAKVKRESHPEKLTMVEKLTNWQRDRSQARST